MNIEIRDSALQARLQKQLEQSGSANVEELLARLLATQEDRIVGFWKTGMRLTPRSGAVWLNWIAAKALRKPSWMHG